MGEAKRFAYTAEGCFNAYSVKLAKAFSHLQVHICVVQIATMHMDCICSCSLRTLNRCSFVESTFINIGEFTFINIAHTPVLSICSLHTISGCGKERRILIGPW